LTGSLFPGTRVHLKELSELALDFDIEAIGFELPEIDFRIQSLDIRIPVQYLNHRQYGDNGNDSH
jgi:hypothetical protein